MTAVRRPEILKRTLHSFFRNCFASAINKCRLIINIDPVGDDIMSHDMHQIVAGYFKYYIMGMPMTPSFPVAFKWTWDRATAPWVFHLEDDWELHEAVDIKFLINLMERFPQYASMRLPFFPSTEATMKNWNKFFPWNGFFYECPRDLRQTCGFCGHPALLRGQFVRNCAPLIDIGLNPEKQFHGGNDALVYEVLRWKYGVYGQPNKPKMIKDIGIEWKNSNKFQKAGSKAFFTQWEKIS